MDKVQSMAFESKSEVSLPEGATIIKKSHTIRVQEIENGFLICKNYDIKYQLSGSDHSDYMYHEKKWYSKDNPMKIEEPKEKSLADKLG